MEILFRGGKVVETIGQRIARAFEAYDENKDKMTNGAEHVSFDKEEFDRGNAKYAGKVMRCTLEGKSLKNVAKQVAENNKLRNSNDNVGKISEPIEPSKGRRNLRTVKIGDKVIVETSDIYFGN